LKTYFIWPEGSITTALKKIHYVIDSNKIESILFKMFPSGYPVLCSSGRSSLYLILNFLKKNRHHKIGLFPYANQCVTDSVSRITTPCFGEESKNCDLRIIYHQWGYVQEKDVKNDTIDDCVDSLCVPGSNLFPSNSNFEIWSLPKIIGSTSGSVIWCKNKKDSLKLKLLRDSSSYHSFQWCLRLLSKKISFIYDHWNGREYNSPKTSKIQNGEIYFLLKKWDEFIKDRKIKLNFLWEFSVKGLIKPKNRLPCVVPIYYDDSILNKIKDKFPSGSRMMEKINYDGSRKLLKIIPFPIHQEVDLDWIKGFVKSLRNN
tara:strand:- start:2542 stop:3489 length:948 start_codon:yes stop_codon:yes gene_type:complete